MTTIAEQLHDVSPGQIVLVVCEIDGVSDDDLASSARRAQVTRARERAAWACRALTGASWPAIAAAMGKRAHVAALQQCRRYEAAASDAEKRLLLLGIKRRLGLEVSA